MLAASAGQTPGMSDDRRRRIDRQAASGDQAAQLRLLRERLREGSLSRGRLRLAAALGNELAARLLGEVGESPTSPVRSSSDTLWPGADAIAALYAAYPVDEPEARAAFAAVALELVLAVQPRFETPYLGRCAVALRAVVDAPSTWTLERLRSAGLPTPLPVAGEALASEAALSVAAGELRFEALGLLGARVRHAWQGAEGDARDVSELMERALVKFALAPR